MLDAAVAALGRGDILVNNASIADPYPLLEMTPNEWDKTLKATPRGASFCTPRAARRKITRGEDGRVINLGSVPEFGAAPNHRHDEASKGGTYPFTKARAIELAPRDVDVQVNAMTPGALEVERSFDDPDDDRGEARAGPPAGRAGLPGDIGPLVVFLSSDGAAYITGQTTPVDGGLTSRR